MSNVANYDAGFANEQMLVMSFLSLSSAEESPFGTVHVATEFDYQRGRTDVVVFTSAEAVIASEAKLEDWRTALH